MPAIFIHDGDRLDHIPAADLPLGSIVVLGDLIGVADRPIPAGALGSLAITGVWDVPAVGTQHGGIGIPVFWDALSGQATLTSSSATVRMGVLGKPLVDADTTIRVLINR